jgi:hypothetical protein
LLTPTQLKAPSTQPHGRINSFRLREAPIHAHALFSPSQGETGPNRSAARLTISTSSHCTCFISFHRMRCFRSLPELHEYKCNELDLNFMMPSSSASCAVSMLQTLSQEKSQTGSVEKFVSIPCLLKHPISYLPVHKIPSHTPQFHLKRYRSAMKRMSTQTFTFVLPLVRIKMQNFLSLAK